ncbi:MAG TPA: site-2 protease family protein [Chitinophagaceae bacterium]|nr:site-2 protease family protein [Chitinophagaceae bacterium]
MENVDETLPEMPDENITASTAEPVVYPPKFRKPEQAQTNAWLRSITSLALYLALGYVIFKQWEVLLLITAIVMIHEFGHFFAMKFFGYSELGIFFIPLLGAYVSGTKREVSQKQSAIILLAGPLPGIIIGMIFFGLNQQGGHYLFGMSYTFIGLLFIILNVLNLLPIYPLDGGQLLNRVFLDEDSIWSKLFIFISIGLLGWFAISRYLSTHNSFYFVLMVFPLMMLFRLAGDKKLTGIEKKIEGEGIHLDVDYAGMPDADYWKIRNILIADHPSFKDLKPTPPFEFDVKEEKVMSTIQGLLHRHVIQDISPVGKIVIAVTWVAAFIAPWLLDMYEFVRTGYIPR